MRTKTERLNEIKNICKKSGYDYWVFANENMVRIANAVDFSVKSKKWRLIFNGKKGQLHGKEWVKNLNKMLEDFSDEYIFKFV